MAQTSAFEIIGPIMIGPSSSHVAGALRIALLARSLVKARIVDVNFILYNSFAATYKGHGTDMALVGGILGMDTDDPQIKDSFNIAREQGVTFRFTESQDGNGKHPNTVDVVMIDETGLETTVRGVSLGGGKIGLSKINGIEVDLTGDLNTIFVTHNDQPGMIAAVSAVLSKHAINIAFMRCYRPSKGALAYTIYECDQSINQEIIDELEHIHHVKNVTTITVPGAGAARPGVTLHLDFTCGKELYDICKKNDWKFGRAMFEREVELTSRQEAISRMQRVVEVMTEEVQAAIDNPQPCMGGLIGGEAHRLSLNSQLDESSAHQPLTGPMLSSAMAYAMAVLERAGTMGLICAAPTAGSSGVVPGAILGLHKYRPLAERDLMCALWSAAAIGYIITRNATVAGAEGGCQAEVGSASAMAAAALTEMMGGSVEQCFNAASIAMINMMGLVCDPIGGLVEIPCQMRNAAGVSNAFAAADLAMAGVKSIVSFDEVVEVMFKVGKALPESLRETAKGGLAATPTACAYCKSCAALHG